MSGVTTSLLWSDATKRMGRIFLPILPKIAISDLYAAGFTFACRAFTRGFMGGEAEFV